MESPMRSGERAQALLGNRLLAALPASEGRRLLADLEVVPLSARAVLHQPGQPLAYVYFPTSGVVSMLAVMANGGHIEVGVAGREGMAGLPALPGAGAVPD